jgi:mRNA interferase MazF
MVRGRVYRAKLEHIKDPKWYVVVSNNRRNRQLEQVLAIRLTTSPKPDLPSIVELGPGEVFTGRALCDDIETLWEDEVQQDLGALSPAVMARIDAGLRAALGLR